MAEEYNDLSRLVNAFEPAMNAENYSYEPHEALALEIHLQISELGYYQRDASSLAVYFKLGVASSNKRYIVRNVERLIDDLNMGRDHVLTPKKTLFVRWSLLSDEQAQLLREIWAQSGDNVRDVPAYMLQDDAQRYLQITPYYLAKFIKQISNQSPVSVKFKSRYGGSTEELLTITYMDAPLQPDFRLQAEGDGYRLDLMIPQGETWATYEVFVEHDDHELIFWPFDSALAETLNTIMRTVSGNSIFIRQNQLAEFIEVVYPMLQRVGEVELPAELAAFIAAARLHTTITINLVQDHLEIIVQFDYGNATMAIPDLEVHDWRGENQIIFAIEGMFIFETENHYGYAFRTVAQKVDFFKRYLPQLQQLDAEVKVAAAVMQQFINPRDLLPEVFLNTRQSLFDISFDIKGISQEEVDLMMTAILNQEQYVELKSGGIVPLNEPAYAPMNAMLAKIRTMGAAINAGTISVNLAAALRLQDDFTATHAKSDLAIQQIFNDLAHPEAFAATVPTEIKADLRDYQKMGLKFLAMLHHHGFGGILADEMGLGKTLQAIAFLQYIKNQAEAPILNVIVVPASVTYNWAQELAKFAPDLRYRVVMGHKQDRVNMLTDLAAVDIVITSYQSLRADEAIYQHLAIDTLILDEAQMVKNAASLTAKAITKLKAAHKFALTGTPIENSLDELWALFNILVPGLFPKKRDFNKLDNATIVKLIQPFMLRRTKAEVLQELPAKTEAVIYNVMTAEQKKVYLAYLLRIQQEVANMSSEEFKRHRIEVLAGITRLRQITDDASLFLDNYQGGSSKLDQLLDMVQTAHANGRRMLIFSQFSSMIHRINTALSAQGLTTFVLTGGTPAQERLAMSNQFNEGAGDVFLISLKAGGTGLNLTGADMVILFDLWWNPAVEEQAVGRAHRMGQAKHVDVYRMVTEGTIEDKILLLQESKRDLFSQVIQNSTEAVKLSESDIRDLLTTDLVD